MQTWHGGAGGYSVSQTDGPALNVLAVLRMSGRWQRLGLCLRLLRKWQRRHNKWPANEQLVGNVDFRSVPDGRVPKRASH